MSNPGFNLTIHMVSSLDGMIAKPDNSISWFEASSPYEKGVTGEDPEQFLKTIDCYVMGSRTYEHALELSKSYGWAYGDKPTVVLTSRPLTSEMKQIEFYSGGLTQLVTDKLKPRYNSVWVVGGAALVRALLQEGLVDEVRLSILPIILGDGLPFFDHVARELPLNLKGTTAYKNGMLELHYEMAK
ncbi:MAG: dihydrofolate reductase family protein [Bacteroidota bacterium]|jgi:dihydrofolate reductase